MHYNNRIESRKRLRLPQYDYQIEGYYYVTLCTQNRQCLFGKINNSEMVLNDAGQMVHNIWLNLHTQYDGCKNDLFVVMPNHLHGILIIERGPARRPAPTLSLPNVMRNFKSFTTTCYMHGVEEKRFEPLRKSFGKEAIMNISFEKMKA